MRAHPVYPFEQIHAAVRLALARRPMNQKQVACLLGVTPQAVQQVEARALRKLRRAVEKAIEARGDAA